MADFLNLSVLVHAGLYVGFLFLVVLSVGFLMNQAWWTGRLLAQLYECSRQCSCLVLARCSMGFGPNPKINGLLQHTFKFNILFLEKFTVIHFD